MYSTPTTLMRWNRIHVVSGAVLWLLLILARTVGWILLSDPEALCLLALWLITPLALPLALPAVAQQKPEPRTALAIRLYPIAALTGGMSLLLRAGPLAGAAATAWLLFTLYLAFLSLVRLAAMREFRRPRELREPRKTRGRAAGSLVDVCLALALIYLPIGGTWLVLARLGLQPLGFSTTTVLLTAIHFHYITL